MVDCKPAKPPKWKADRYAKTRARGPGERTNSICCKAKRRREKQKPRTNASGNAHKKEDLSSLIQTVTVGFGISPNRPEGSRTVPPVGNCTLPRRTYSVCGSIIAPRFLPVNDCVKKWKRRILNHKAREKQTVTGEVDGITRLVYTIKSHKTEK